MGDALSYLNNQLENIKKIVLDIENFKNSNFKSELENSEKNSLQQEKEQIIMKYNGITIHKNLKCDTWYTRFRYGGKQHYICARTQQECYDKLKVSLVEVKNKVIVIDRKFTDIKVKVKPTSNITFVEWYKKWLELYKIGKQKQTTIEDYNKSLSYIPKEILEQNISLIKPMAILEMLNNITASRTRQKVYELLNMVFDKAMKNEIIEKNIITFVDKPKHTKENSQPLTKEQEVKFINACKQVAHGDYFLLCLYQGLRKGECLGITDADIDFDKKTLTIDKAINDDNEFDTTKNTQSERVMPLFDGAIKLLEKYKNHKGRIFNFCPKTQNKTLKKINEQLDFHVKTKDLRSTFITRCQEMAIPEFVIQSWVGHRIGSKVTSSVYTKYNNEDNKGYIDVYNNNKFYSLSTQATN